MKLALNDPIWSLLYGPYGVEDVPGILTRLAQGWDQPLADDLYWEKLHHQEDLYPATYAALPWLWEVAPKDLKNLSFLSWIRTALATRMTRGICPHRAALTRDCRALQQTKQTTFDKKQRRLWPNMPRSCRDWRAGATRISLSSQNAAKLRCRTARPHMTFTI